LVVNGRAEWFDDQDGAAPGTGTGFANTFYEATLGVAIHPFPTNSYGSNLVIRPELRVDYADKPTWDGGTDHYQFSGAIEGYFTF